MTSESAALRAAIAAKHEDLDEILSRYKAASPRLFGSVARGEGASTSNVDLLVDLLPGGGNELLRVSGIAEELSNVLGRTFDVATPRMRSEVSVTALAEAVPV